MTEPATCSGDLVRAAWIIRSGNIAAESDLADRIEALAAALEGPITRLSVACDERGLPHDVDALIRHERNNGILQGAMDAQADALEGPITTAERAVFEIASSFEVYGAETADNPQRALAEAHTLVRDLAAAGFVIVPRSSAASEQQEPAGSDDER